MSRATIYLLLCLACCAHLVCGETVNILINDYQVPLVEIHIANYSALTGHTVSFLAQMQASSILQPQLMIQFQKVNLIPLNGYQALREQILGDLRKGSPFYDAFVFSGQMKSELILCSECDPEQRPLIAPLTEAIRNDPNLEWNDVATFQRSVNSAYNGDIYTVPVDGGKLCPKLNRDLILFLILQTFIICIIGRTSWNDMALTFPKLGMIHKAKFDD
jgi:hypothetical protein